MGSVIQKDVPPYVMVDGHPGKPRGINSEGLRRRGFSAEAVQKLRKAYKLLYMSGLKLEQATRALVDMAEDCPEIQIVVDFLDRSERSIIR